MTEFWIGILLGVAGIAMHQIKKVIAANGRNTTFLDIRKAFRKNLFSIVFNVLTIFIIVVVKDDLESIYPITRFSIFIIGWWGDSFLMGLLEAKKPKVK